MSRACASGSLFTVMLFLIGFGLRCAVLAFDRELERFYAYYSLNARPATNVSSSVAWLALAGGHRDHLVPAHLALLDESYPVRISHLHRVALLLSDH